MNLARLQSLAQHHLLSGGDIPTELAQAIASPAGERWSIYVEAYRLRLTDALATQYPALVVRCGRAAFTELAAAFIRGHPSNHRSIRDYGAELADFVRGDHATAEQRLRGELARFEWLLAAAFDAADIAATRVEDLAAIAPHEWPTLCFAPVPSLQRFDTITNAVAAWREIRRGLEIDPVAGPALEPAASVIEPIPWLIWRPRWESEFRSLPTGEAAALDRLLAGTPFATLCGELADSHGEQAPLQAAAWLKGWLTEGLLLRV